MIEPNMATMLVYIFTDAALDAATLDRMLRARGGRVVQHAVRRHATRARRTPAPFSRTGSPARWTRRRSLDALTAGCIRMTEMLARDGEGATQLLRATVRGARDPREARRVAKSLVNSPLVKTMVYGADPNVGRMLMAVGKCFDCTIRPATHRRVDQRHAVVRGGQRLDFDEDVVRDDARPEVVDIEVVARRRRRRGDARTAATDQGYIEENAAYYSS